MANMRFTSLSPSSIRSDIGNSYPDKEVMTGEIATGHEGEMLTANALGSCIAVVVHDPVMKVGGLAHVMLPGRAPSGTRSRKELRYAEDATEELLCRMEKMGALKRNLRICLIGGGNVLRRDDDVICEMNVRSVRKAIEKKGLTIEAFSTGGYERRRVRLNIASGCVLCCVGSDVESVLINGA